MPEFTKRDKKTRERAEEMKRKLMREAEEARKKAEREVEEARKRANEAMEEVNRQMKMEEEELDRVLLDKKRNEEFARIEAEAWEELSCGKAEEGTSTRKVPHLKIRDYSKPFSENVTTVKNAPLHNFPPRTSLLTDIPESSVQIDRPFPVTFAELPDQDSRIKVKIQALVKNRKVSLSLNLIIATQSKRKDKKLLIHPR